ncbi:LysM peptidoglycan-binding domain-containing protein [Actinoplanes sp. NBC_00393]|uniref:LysM peptidoglycan-binding domain-containing protein n=1 Tax=Actinoplanes sp. NBC_00393 TaxID=2975953 RepID=UPI002E2233A2
MPRLGHGRPITEQDVSTARSEVAEVATRSRLSFALTPPVRTHDFDLLFPTLQEDEANLLPRSPDTPARLKALGATMEDADRRGEDSPIPAAYTYLGQFIDHDITLEAQQPGLGSGTMAELLDPNMAPLQLADIRNALRNLRTATLDLDSLYGLPAPRIGDKLGVGPVVNLPQTGPPFDRPPGKSDDNDLPREPESDDITHDRAALIGDPRNDENTIVSQLHVAFLKAHNALVDQGLSFSAARRVLRQHYQHIVVHDFLKRVADPEIVDDIVTNGNRWFDPYADAFFMPLEFAVAGYRFGHSMVRGTYNFNLNFPNATLEQLFTFTALSGQLGGSPRLPENWIIQWERIIGDAGQKTRRIDTNLARVGGRALFNLQTVDGQTETPPDAGRLAVRNLLRGYRLRLPTGQAVAALLGVPVMGKDDLLAAAGTPAQRAALEAGDFQSRTPLWYYVLAEAQHFNGGAHLGPVGSTLVAEVLVGLVRRSEDSILKLPAWHPTLPAAKPGTFELADLLRLADVLPGREPPRTYTVRSGDSLTRIAQNELGDRDRWTEIFLLNRAVIRNPNRIFPGQVLVLPPRQPTGPIPRLYVVKRGDTLSEIARAELGNANRWQEIFALNRDVISNPDRIIPGQILALPAR